MESEFIDDIAGGADEPSFLLMKFGQFGLKINDVSGVASDVTSASSACPCLINGSVHGFDDIGVLAHAKVVVGTPDCNLLKDSFIISSNCLGKLVLLSQNVYKRSVTAFVFQNFDLLFAGFEIIERLVLGLLKLLLSEVRTLDVFCRFMSLLCFLHHVLHS